ncbi:RNA polymerase sigma factor [Rossellomorea marisflavi]|uniref:RNA polymerase sigma factor n=1 Tax=Rossellomorea marisflavi TaxID=189381 RepID=UPI001C4794D4|nr:RNA polymerase sigma factor [Rossellomorea marisflavi]MBV6684908.1 RNA polymerase sigma factor [Bacillus sp. JRC01]MDW4525862.1 RNA polymerase sigma factor [Rossellomorea marisflavi]
MNFRSAVKKAKKGSKDALLQLIMEEKENYYRLAYVYVGNEHDAMDAMEDMIVTVYEKIHQLNDPDAFYSWSKTILVNLCKTMLRKQNRLVLKEEWSDEGESSNPLENSDRDMEIQDMLLQLNEHQAEAIRLKYILDLDYSTAAKVMGVSVGTAKSRVFQGLKKLRETFGGTAHE